MARGGSGRISTLTGDRELIRALGKFSEGVDRRIMRPALSKSLTPTVKAMRRKSPVGKGKILKKSVGKSVKRNKEGVTIAKAGYNVGKGKRKAPHAHLITLGTADRYTKSGAYRGKVEPRALAKEAWEETKGESQKILREDVKKRIKKHAAKVRSKK